MHTTIHFLLNNHTVSTNEHPATVVLDFLRRNEHLTGTKEGCREGDCGACTVLVGELETPATGEPFANEPVVVYKPVNSCLLPLGDMHGKHLVSVEGINLLGTAVAKPLTAIQQAMVNTGGTQCGFCTPGFIVSMTGYMMSTPKPTADGMTRAIDGNICRCTGYASIKRAIEHTVQAFDATPQSKQSQREHWQRLVAANIVPEYFLAIPKRLTELQTSLRANTTTNGATANGTNAHTTSEHSHEFIVGGGTDLFVQKPEALLEARVHLLNRLTAPETIREEDGYCIVAAHTPIAAFLESPIIRRHFPRIGEHLKLFASTPIRNRATFGGNINNASPIGDMTALLLALNAELTLTTAPTTSTTLPANGSEQRICLLQEYFKAYKTTDRKPHEILSSVRFRLPDEHTLFNFEKVSRRTHLDIASVNSAVSLRLQNGVIHEAHFSAGGVAAVPLYLKRTSSLLIGKTLSPETASEASFAATQEISPISDARGSADYKRLLLRQLVFAHFLTFSPELVLPEEY